MHLQGSGPGVFSRGCPTCDEAWPKAQGRDRISKPLHTISAGFEKGSLQALTAVLIFHPLLQLSVQTTAPVISHIPWPPSGTSTEKSCKGEERFFWVLHSAKEENCPMGIEKRESCKVNGSFHTRMQETTGLCTSCLNGVVGLSRASLKEGLHQYLKGVIQLLADDSQVSVSMSYISYPWSVTLCYSLAFPLVLLPQGLSSAADTRQPNSIFYHKLNAWVTPWSQERGQVHPTSLLSDEFLLSTAPQGLLPRPPTLSLASKMSQVCDKEEQTPENQIQPRCQLNQHRAGAGAETAASFHFVACKFCASNQQGWHFHLKAKKVQKHRAWRHFHP